MCLLSNGLLHEMHGSSPASPSTRCYAAVRFQCTVKFSFHQSLNFKLNCLSLTPLPPPPLLISLTFYICTFLLDSFAPVPTSASLIFRFVSARQTAIVLSLILVLLSGTHCLFISESCSCRYFQVHSDNVSSQHPGI